MAAVVIDGGTVTGVRLDDGRLVESDAVVVAPRFVARSEPLRALGITPVAAPMGTGEVIETDSRGATTVPGIYAAGNVADVGHQVLQAAGDGGRIAAAINADLAHEDAAVALGARVTAPRAGTAGTRARPSGGAASPTAHVVEMEHIAPGSALDVGCGEGADALWLAQRGWHVTAVDISQLALDRARRAAEDVGVEVDRIRADVASEPPARSRYDLVSVLYPALRHAPGDAAIHSIIDAVAPGGTLLVVGHDLDGSDHHPHRGFDPADYVQPPDVARHLDAAWTIEVQETRPRIRPPGFDGPDRPDVVLRARLT